MKAHKLFLVFVISLLSISCGTQRKANQQTYNGPLVRTEFYGCEFGASRFITSNKLVSHDAIKTRDGKYLLLNQEFAGYNWHYVTFNFSDKKFSGICFEQEFIRQIDAEDRKEAIYRLLLLKYKDVVPTDDGYRFMDEASNVVLVETRRGMSRGCYEYWYCNLMYLWGPGLLLELAESYYDI